MLICILTKNVITSCSVTMMLFLHLEVKPLMTLTTVLYLSCRSEERFSRNAETDLVCRLLLEKKKQIKPKHFLAITLLTQLAASKVYDMRHLQPRKAVQ